MSGHSGGVDVSECGVSGRRRDGWWLGVFFCVCFFFFFLISIILIICLCLVFACFCCFFFLVFFFFFFKLSCLAFLKSLLGTVFFGSDLFRYLFQEGFSRLSGCPLPSWLYGQNGFIKASEYFELLSVSLYRHLNTGVDR